MKEEDLALMEKLLEKIIKTYNPNLPIQLQVMVILAAESGWGIAYNSSDRDPYDPVGISHIKGIVVGNKEFLLEMTGDKQDNFNIFTNPNKD